MKITRLYTGTDNKSYFEDVEFACDQKGDITSTDAGRQSVPIEVTSLILREVKADHNPKWHTAPRRQFIVVFEGELEIEIEDGTKRRFGPGSIFLAEDTTGQGHITRSVNNQPRKVAFITLD